MGNNLRKANISVFYLVAITLFGFIVAGLLLMGKFNPIDEQYQRKSSKKPVSSSAEKSSQINKRIVLKGFDTLPLRFERNRGQTESLVKFLSRGRGDKLFLTSNEVVLAISEASSNKTTKEIGNGEITKVAKGTENSVLRVHLVDANPEPSIIGIDEQPGKVNYFIGNDKTNWRTNIPTYAKVKYKDVYPGIDLVFYGNQGNLEYDFVVAPGADPKAINIAIKGDDKIDLENQGHLVLKTDSGQIQMRKPLVYQELDGIKQEISGSYTLNDILGISSAPGNADCNNDGNVNILDVTCILNIILGGSPTQVNCPCNFDLEFWTNPNWLPFEPPLGSPRARHDHCLPHASAIRPHSVSF